MANEPLPLFNNSLISLLGSAVQGVKRGLAAADKKKEEKKKAAATKQTFRVGEGMEGPKPSRPGPTVEALKAVEPVQKAKQVVKESVKKQEETNAAIAAQRITPDDFVNAVKSGASSLATKTKEVAVGTVKTLTPALYAATKGYQEGGLAGARDAYTESIGEYAKKMTAGVRLLPPDATPEEVAQYKKDQADFMLNVGGASSGLIGSLKSILPKAAAAKVGKEAVIDGPVANLSKNLMNSLENAPAGLKPGGVERAIEEIKAGVMPPIKVRDIEDGRVFIEDGRHHLEAARVMGLENYPVEDVTHFYTPKANIRITKTPEAAPIPEAAGGAVPPIVPPKPPKTKGKAVLPESEGLPSNIRTDKFQISPEGQANLDRIMAENGGFSKQRRGVQTFKDAERLADELRVSSKLKPGTALNSEELQSLGNTVANLQMRVDNLSAKLLKEGGDSTANKLALAEAKEELTYTLSSLSGATAEAGRALSILRNIRKAKEGGGDADLIQRIIKMSGGGLDATEVARRLVDIGDDPVAKLRFIRDTAKISRSDKLYEVWLNSILANPRTHMVNSLSNTLSVLSAIPRRTIQAAIQNPKNRKVFFGEIPHQAVGMIEGLRYGVQKAIHTLARDVTLDDLDRLDIKSLPAIGGRTGQIVRTPTRLLAAADDLFKSVVSTSEMRALAYRNAKREGLKGKEALERMYELVENPTKQMYDEVNAEALRATFQTPLGPAGQSLIKLRNTAWGVKYILPFIKTPTNIAKEALKTSPAGFANVLKKMARGEYKNLPDTEITRDIAQATMGSMVAIPVMLAALRGDITGAAPHDAADRDAFFREGKQPYSVRVGDKWVSYRTFEPFSTVVGMIADLSTVVEEKGLERGAQQVVGILGRNITDKTFLAGLSTFLDAIDDPNKMEAFAQKTVQGFVPFSGALRFATQSMDPVVRQPEGFGESLAANFPGLSQGIAPKLNVFGEEITRTLSQVATPVGVTNVKKDKVDEELKKIGVVIGFPSKKIGGIDADDDEYRELLRQSGNTIKAILNDAVETEEWKAMNSREKEKFIGEILDEVRSRTREMVSPIKAAAPDIRKELRDRGYTSEEADRLANEIVQKALSEGAETAQGQPK